MEIQEWRNKVKIGMVERDMQIEVFETTNNDPVNGPLKDICVEAGDTVDFFVTSTDQDGDSISLKATSGALELATCKARFFKIASGKGIAKSRFFWIPCYENVRNQPYNVIIKSEDDNSQLSLFDIDNMNIKVLGPAPKITRILPEGKFIKLSWNGYGSTSIAGFNIYRRDGRSSLTVDSCTNGIPGAFGFEKVGYVPGASTVSFIDTENGQGLQFGTEYAYRIVAVFSNGTESKTSNEVSSSIVSGIPLMTNVSVQTTSTNGSLYVAWAKPVIPDTIPGPFEYAVYRSEGIAGTEYSLLKTVPSADLNDTVYIDNQLNTQAKSYIYKVELYNNTPGNRYLIGEPGVASSLFMEVTGGDRKVKFTMKRNVPWINSRYDIFRLNETTMSYDSVGTSNQLTFFDTGLENGKEYCYYIRSSGSYLREDYPKNLINLSQKGCATPVDNEPPCPPDLKVTSQCDSLYNTLTWTVTDPVCFEDVAGYNIYYKPNAGESLSLLLSINNKSTFRFNHPAGESIAGCYAVSAFDAEGNEGEKSVMICVDSCNFYKIPNVFTPNGDDINDYLVAKTSGLVEQVDFQLFNRNGLLLFRTAEPKLNWDGTYNGKIVSPGVYFYQCDVFERRITGLEQFHLSGFVHVITEEDAIVKKQELK
jgi:gliding motility-associated-like protein